MRTPALLCGLALVAACAPAEEQPAAEIPATPAVSLADFAGTWVVTGVDAASDSALITYELNAAATWDGWTSTLPGRDPMPVRVLLVDGDSVVAEAGPFESALRPGVMVTTHTVARLEGDMLTGTLVAHYGGTGPDSVLRGRIQGTRKTP
jgi:hypothetical protein